MFSEQTLITPKGQRIAIVAALRTPFHQKDTGFKDSFAIDLGTMVTNELLNRVPIERDLIQQLVFGQVTQHSAIQNISRGIAVSLGMPWVQAYSISSSCITGLQAVANVTTSILSGSIKAGIAGGSDSISNSSISLNPRLIQVVKDIIRAEGLEHKFHLIRNLTWADLKPYGVSLKDYVTDYSVADVSEQMAKNFHISRQEQDEFTVRSHRLANEAWQGGSIRESVMLSFPSPYDNFVVADNLIEHSLKPHRYERYSPIVDKKYGSVTDWNIAKSCDGAGAVMLIREDIAKAEGLDILGYIRSYAMTGNDVWENMLTGSTYASSIALSRANVQLADIDLIDMHESSAAQTLANLRLFEDEQFAQHALNRTAALGQVDMDKFNVLGGSLAYGNPRAVTSLRILIQSLFELKRRGGRLSLVAASGLGGLGAAMVLESE
ncbi:acetyl-CoA C-acyltransferase [Conservatibacter flavescens]|uniref:Acetyl-CoA C-acyltransferase n=1 Tax=Conservatibacter flavescens TaxID=28161 RepID=A0A2M8S237_9PAST|nr:acetyl-CoA C-acyltransferase [Conservatibacter flavescens]PJG85184.1 acetyl-CoA C-acyltransferase [Conservatibacter flavescens]